MTKKRVVLKADLQERMVKKLSYMQEEMVAKLPTGCPQNLLFSFYIKRVRINFLVKRRIAGKVDQNLPAD
jgi:hypothetical protein